ncbi:MAG: SUMF1/EgtB/PvdO family nonheme iron enzyme, partial [Chloroflexi bacterium]|nr:SUMF1/EgtB/PvdO family nonheme iron enzyme [Chloroflexota bacterium]
GSGKSSFVNFVAICMAGELLDNPDMNLKLLRQPLPEEDEYKREQKKPEPQPWKHGALLPVRVVLRDFAARGLPAPDETVTGDTLWQFIIAELGTSLNDCAGVLRKTLLEKGGLILLDGLDEVPDAGRCRERVKAAVQGFARDFPDCHILVTSRTYAYQRQDWKLDGFAEVVLSPFTPAQIDHFVERWYAHIGPMRGLDQRDAAGKAAVLKNAIASSKRLSELASSPLLLTLMASLHAWRGGSLPEKREELYNDAVERLRDQWESQKLRRRPDGTFEQQEPSLAEYLKAGKDAIRAELNRIAFEAHRDQPRLSGTADIPHERLIKALLDVSRARKADVDVGNLDRYVRERSGLLAERGNDVYAFPHRTFQEYLAACYLTGAGFPRELVRLVGNDPERWREVTLLAGAKAYRGTASAAWNLAEVLCPADPPTGAALADETAGLKALLAAQTLLENEGRRLAEVDVWNRPKRQRVQAWMRAIVECGWLAPHDRAQAGIALAALGDDRDLEELVEVPAGPFLMGSADNDTMAYDDEKQQHEVALPAFKIGKYPVTCAQYLRFVEAADRQWRWDEGRKLERANHPVVAVSWHDARAFCDWLTQRWRAEGRIKPAEIVRLPSEAEWEKAARGADGRLWPWAGEWDVNKCNNGGLGLVDTTAVGMFPTGASPFGCMDMAGNVFEWTSSVYGRWNSQKNEMDFTYNYPYKPDDGREGEDASSDNNTLRVLRGGSFRNDRDVVRCTYRNGGYPNVDVTGSGFRVVVSPVSSPSAP